MRSGLADQAYQAVGVVAGRLDGGSLVLLDGERFAATPSPELRQWLRKEPEVAGGVRLWLVYPRTLRAEAGGLAFFVVGTPEDQSDPRWASQVDRFNIKGQVVVSRAGLDTTAVWIPRNDAPPLGKRRHPDWKGRVLFLKRSLRPVRRWKGADVWVDAKRVGRELVIASYQPLAHHPTSLRLPSGWQVPWPFRPTRSSVAALCSEALQSSLKVGGITLPMRPGDVYGVGPDGKPMAAAEWVDLYDYRPTLKRKLRQFNELQTLIATELLPRQAIDDGQALPERDTAREAEQAARWGRFFKAICNYLDSLEPGQLIALSKRCDPLLALLTPTLQQTESWFTLEPSNNNGWKVWFEGAPVPNRVKRLVVQLLEPTPPADTPSAAQAQAQAQPAGPPSAGAAVNAPLAENQQRLEEAVAYFRAIGCPPSYSARQTAAWVVQCLVAEGLTDEQITIHGWIAPGLLPELKRVELPFDLDH